MTHDPISSKKEKTHTRHTRSLVLMLSIGMLAGVLIWAKLRLVTDIPRSAYADPREVDQPDQQDQDHNTSQDDAIESRDSSLSDFAHDESPTP